LLEQVFMSAVGVGSDGKMFYSKCSEHLDNDIERGKSRFEGFPVWMSHCVGNWPSVIVALYIICIIFSVCEDVS
jgi:hypothetical protein